MDRLSSCALRVKKKEKEEEREREELIEEDKGAVLLGIAFDLKSVC
jgi:hypothetical protein